MNTATLLAWPAFLAALHGGNPPSLESSLARIRFIQPDLSTACFSPPSPGQREYRMEVAATPARQRRGLGGRRELPPDSGMLFVFDPPAPARFWMKDTLVPLLLLYFDRDGVLLSAHRMPVEPDPANPSRHFEENRPVSVAVELPDPQAAATPDGAPPPALPLALKPGKTSLCAGQIP